MTGNPGHHKDLKEAKLGEATEQIYAINAPKIFLETLSARSTTLIFAATYIAFILGFSIDINSAYKGFTMSDVSLSGINDSPNLWTGAVKSLSNVISVSVTVQHSNFSSVLSAGGASKFAIYDATIWACYVSEGCGTEFDSTSTFDSPTIWHEVLSTQSNYIDLSKTDGNSLTASWPLIPTTFQNQESIPARGKVRSYFFKIDFTDDPGGVFKSLPSSSTATPTIRYVINVLTRPGSSVTSGTFSVILLFVVLGTLVSFIYVMMKQKKKWLTEQKWVCYYLAALVLFINPIYCVIIWMPDMSPQVVFAFYFFDAMGQSAFFVVWLLFADNINRKLVSYWKFYCPKILIGFSIFAITLVGYVYQFPSVSPSYSRNSKRSPVQAVSNWSPDLQYSYTAVSIAVLLLMLIWVLYWLVTLILTGRTLKSLPYMNTRYLQLSYRFFLLQAYLLAAYFVFQYCFIIYFLLRERASGGLQGIVALTDYLNALSRQQTQLFGKVVFLSVYALVLTFLFLPSSLVDTNLATALASTYVLTEKEMRRVEKSRRIAISNNTHVLAGVVQTIVHAKVEVFCVETALAFCNLSFEAYYDAPNLKTEAGYDTKMMDLLKYGYELVDIIYRPDHETFCIIARHESLNKLVVCFRGTSCKKHWSDNLNYSQRELDLPVLSDLDAIDGLGLPEDVDIMRSSRLSMNSNIEMMPRRGSLSGVDGVGGVGGDVEQSIQADSGQMSQSTLPPYVPKVTTPQEHWRRTSLHPFSRANEMVSAGSSDDDDDDDYAEDDADPGPKTNADSSTNQNIKNRMVHSNSLRQIIEEEEGQVEGENGNGGGQDEDDEMSMSNSVAHTAGQGNDLDGTRTAQLLRDANGYLTLGASTLGRGMTHVAFTVAGATSNVVGGAADLVVSVAAITPGLKSLVRPQIHTGFWDAYAVVRDDLHAIIRRELLKKPAHLYFIGHSLGGALATLGALDFKVHTVPRVNAFLARERSNELKKNLDLKSNQTTNAPNRRRSLAETLRWASMGHIGSKKETPETPPTPSSPSQPPSITHSSPSNTHPPLTHPPLTHPLTHPPITHPLSLTHPPSLTLSHPPSPLYSHSLNKYLDDSPYINESPRHDDRHYLPKAKRGGVKRVRLTMYNFGSPRVGNGFFALLYNRCVPDSFRTVIDGDLVTSMPPTGYRHIGTQAVVDNLGAGSIIIDPSFIERRLRTHTKSSVSVHSLLVYRKGLTGVKEAAEFMKEQAVHFQIDTDRVDVVRLALRAATLARNNAFSRSPARCFQKKSKNDMDLPVVPSPYTEKTPHPQAESDDVPVISRSDFIPPSGLNHKTDKRKFELMDTETEVKDRDSDFNGPLFTRLSDDSPDQEKQSHEWGNNLETKDPRLRRSFSLSDGCDNSAGIAADDDEDQGQMDKKLKDVLEYEEAAHYANDLVTAHSLVEGMFPPPIRPLDSYVRNVLKSIESYTPAWTTQASTDPGASTQNIIIPPTTKQDGRHPLLQSEL